MMDLHDVLIEPVLSEKATALRGQGKYVFKVRPDTNKIQIKKAVSELFNVKVINVTTLNVHGKIKKVRGKTGRISGWKKAIVSIAPGQAIKIFEGV